MMWESAGIDDFSSNLPEILKPRQHKLFQAISEETKRKFSTIPVVEFTLLS
jgi:hypothetical protein